MKEYNYILIDIINENLSFLSNKLLSSLDEKYKFFNKIFSPFILVIFYEKVDLKKIIEEVFEINNKISIVAGEKEVLINDKISIFDIFHNPLLFNINKEKELLNDLSEGQYKLL